MYKLLRFYNQNRRSIWFGILVFISIIVLIQLFNQFAKIKNESKNNEEVNQVDEKQQIYNNQSQSIISNDSVADIYKYDFSDLIDEFYTYCVNGNPKEAYLLLSTGVKNLKFPTEKLFESLYYNQRFQGDKQYSFQSWSIDGEIYVYQVKIFDNMLTSGKKNDTYIEDYVTIVPEDGKYKLNIDEYITTENINKESSNDDMTIRVRTKDVYMDHEIYTIDIKNNSDSTQLLDTKTKSKTLYIEDLNENKYDSYLFENKDEDLILEPKQMKTIKIKFNSTYRQGISMKKMVFSDIVNYDKYLNNSDATRQSIEVVFDE